MCGEADEDAASAVEEQLYARFLVHAKRLLSTQQHEKPSTDPLYAYMDRLFADTLARAIRDNETVEEKQRYEMLSMQPVVFARLAGFLAAHLSLDEDPLRKTIEALMLGYSEAETIAPDHDHDHNHAHGHRHH